MEDPFILEARKHQAEADRNGQLAFQTFIGAIVAFGIYAYHLESEGWWWLFFWFSVANFTRMVFALEARWFHRNAVRLALDFYEYSQR